MASRMQWIWVWASSRRWWRTGKPSMLQSLALQRVGHHCVTEQQQKVIFSLDFSTSNECMQRHLPTWWVSLFFLQFRFTGRSSILSHRASQMAQWWRIHLLMQEVQVQSLGEEYLLEKEIATHSSTLTWKIPWTEELTSYSPWSHRRVGHDLMTKQQLLQSFFYWIEHWYN